MNSQIVIVYQFNILYQIIKEIEKDIKLDVFEVLDQEELNKKISNLENYIIVSNKSNLINSNILIFENFPISIFKIIEKINITFLKTKYNDQSHTIVKNYFIDLNSRNIFKSNRKLKLTEKEIKIIMYLNKSSKPATTSELQNNVWGYQTKLETHTVETHIYRLRKKFLNFFDDDNFIISTKDGYEIK